MMRQCGEYMLNRIIISYLYSSRSRRHNVNLHAMCNAAHRLTIIITPSHTISQMQALSGSLMYKYTNYPVLMSYNNDDTVRIGYSVTASNDLSVIAMKSRIIKSKTLLHHTNCIGYSDLGYSDKPVITIGRREGKRAKLYKR